MASWIQPISITKHNKQMQVKRRHLFLYIYIYLYGKFNGSWSGTENAKEITTVAEDKQQT